MKFNYIIKYKLIKKIDKNIKLFTKNIKMSKNKNLKLNLKINYVKDW